MTDSSVAGRARHTPRLAGKRRRLGRTELVVAFAVFLATATAARYGAGGWLASDAHHAGSSAHMSAAEAAAAGRPETIVKPLSCTPLPHVAGKSITTALVEFPPNAYTPAHRHPGSVTAYVIKAHIRSQMEGGKAVVYGPGQTWFEAPSELHLFAENASATEPAELLAIFVANNNCGPLVIPEPKHSQ